MIHTFLLQPGQWKLDGYWYERNGLQLPIKGRVSILWNQPNWFTWNEQLVFPEDSDHLKEKEDLGLSELMLTYRGYLSFEQKQYNFVLKHNLFGEVEGNGWITHRSIVQRYWVLNDKKRRQGFETLYQESEETYHFCNAFTQGHQMLSTLEATLSRDSG